MTFCEELAPTTRKKRRCSARWTGNVGPIIPENYDDTRASQTRPPALEREQAVQSHQTATRQHRAPSRRPPQESAWEPGPCITQIGTTINIEKSSRSKHGKSSMVEASGLRAPGLFVAHLARLVAKTGGTLHEVSAFQTRLSQYCHQCGQYHRKPRSQRWHACPCGFGPVQRDLYAAFLLAYLEPEQTIPFVTQHVWEGAEPRLRAVMEDLQQRANEGQTLPRSMGVSAPSQSCPCRSASAQKSCLSPPRAVVSLESIGSGE